MNFLPKTTSPQNYPNTTNELVDCRDSFPWILELQDISTRVFQELLTCLFSFRSKLGRAVRGVLTQAKMERRLICGLLPAIAHLEKASDDVLLCVLPETRPGDAATHMQTVLLQAFCYENYIPVVQVNIIFYLKKIFLETDILEMCASGRFFIALQGTIDFLFT